VGFFGSYLFDGQWKPVEGAHGATEPWLTVEVHDSDITTVVYRPPGPGSGVAYLGCTPRTYFEDESASAPTDVRREARGLAAWWAGLHGVVGEAEMAAKERELSAFLAEDVDPADVPDDLDEDIDDLDDGEIFVEVKTVRFLSALGLSAPDGFPHA
jgi:hypothetical protein